MAWRTLFCGVLFISFLGCAPTPEEAPPQVRKQRGDDEQKIAEPEAPADDDSALDALVKLEASLEFDDHDQVTAVSLAHRKVKDADLVHLEHFPMVTRLHLQGTQITDAGLAHLEKLSALRLVNVSETEVSREGRDRLRATHAGASVFPLDLAPVAVIEKPEPAPAPEPDVPKPIRERLLGVWVVDAKRTNKLNPDQPGLGSDLHEEAFVLQFLSNGDLLAGSMDPYLGRSDLQVAGKWKVKDSTAPDLVVELASEEKTTTVTVTKEGIIFLVDDLNGSIAMKRVPAK